MGYMRSYIYMLILCLHESLDFTFFEIYTFFKAMARTAYLLAE